MDFTDPKFWFDLFKWLIAMVAVGIAWLRKPGEAAITGLGQLREHVDTQHKATLTDIASLRNHVDSQYQSVAGDMGILRERISHMPTAEELAELGGSVKALAASQEALVNAQERMTNSLTRIENYLLNNK